MKRTIVIWGAGRIGRGFVADIFNSPDWRTVFVDIDHELVDTLNREGKYPVYKATRDGIEKITIENGFTAVHTGDQDALSRLFLEKDLLLDIAVHEPKLPEVSDMLAPLFALRAKAMPDSPIDVMMNVNMPAPDERFRELMKARLTGEARAYFDEKCGVTGIFAMCISPIAPDSILKNEPLALWNNGFHEQAVGRPHFRGEAPRLPRLRLTEDVAREETRKLYTLNMAHALVCYTGLQKNLKTAREAALHPETRPLLTGALEEASIGLISEYGFGDEEMRAWRETIIALLENPYIEDGLQRLGADTRRKLGAFDRLVGPSRLCLKAGKTPECLVRAIRAGFDYENDDEGTKAVRSLVLNEGLAAAVSKTCALSENDELYRLILAV